MPHREKNQLSTLSREELKRIAKQEKLLSMAAEQWPGIMSITDYTDGAPKLVYMNDKLLTYEGLEDVEYYGRTKGEVLSEGDTFSVEDERVLKSDKPHPFLNTDRYGCHWIKYKWRITDGDKRYIVAQLIEVTDAMVSVFVSAMNQLKEQNDRIKQG